MITDNSVTLYAATDRLSNCGASYNNFSHLGIIKIPRWRRWSNSAVMATLLIQISLQHLTTVQQPDFNKNCPING